MINLLYLIFLPARKISIKNKVFKIINTSCTSSMIQRKKIGLVLSGGGMHGFAHIGVLRVLEEKGIKADLIVGSSIGALTGVLLASGKNSSEIEKLFLEASMIKLMRPTIGKGLFRGETIVKYVLDKIKTDKFDDLKTPLVINATNISKGTEVTFKKGNLFMPLNASIAIPGAFIPVEHNGDLLVDGGFYDVSPMHLADDMDVIIVIEVSRLDYKITPKSGILDIMKQSIANLQQRIIQLNYEAHKKSHEVILITPNVAEYSIFEYRKEKHKEMIKIGEETAKTILGDIRARKILEI